jgi:hypothetical protein
MVAGWDASDELVTMAPAVLLYDQTGSHYVITEGAAYDDSVTEYLLASPSGGNWTVEPVGVNSDLGIIFFSITDGSIDESFLKVASAYEWEAETLTYWIYDGNDIDIDHTAVQITGAASEDGIDYYFVDLLEDLNEDIWTFPGVLVNDDGCATAVVLSTGEVWAVSLDADNFSAESGLAEDDDVWDSEEQSDSSETEETEVQQDDGDLQDGTDTDDTDDTDSDNEDKNGVIGKAEKSSGNAVYIIIGVAAVIVVAVIVAVLKRKKGGTPADETAASYVSDIPVANSIRIVANGGVMSGREVTLNNGAVEFGRDKICAVCFPAETPGISRNHCKVYQDGARVMLEDLGSTYGTFLEGYGRLSANAPVEIKKGDSFYLGEKGNLFLVQ